MPERKWGIATKYNLSFRQSPGRPTGDPLMAEWGVRKSPVGAENGLQNPFERFPRVIGSQRGVGD
jgi:hypothetical protein